MPPRSSLIKVGCQISASWVFVDIRTQFIIVSKTPLEQEVITTTNFYISAIAFDKTHIDIKEDVLSIHGYIFQQA